MSFPLCVFLWVCVRLCVFFGCVCLWYLRVYFLYVVCFLIFSVDFVCVCGFVSFVFSGVILFCVCVCVCVCVYIYLLHATCDCDLPFTEYFEIYHFFISPPILNFI